MALSEQLQRTIGIAGTSTEGRNLIIADGLCPKIAELLPGALHELVALGQSQNPLAEISTELEKRRLKGRPIRNLHIVAHGRPGAVRIGGQWVDSTALITHADQLAQWKVGTIALWSCEAGADHGFSALLEELTGAAANTTAQRINGNPNTWKLAAETEHAKPAPAPFDTRTIKA